MQKTTRIPAFILLCATVIITFQGCGGGGGGASASNTVTLSGTISVSEGLAVDSDVNDTSEDETNIANDSIGAAQTIANPVSLGGYVNVAGAGSSGLSYLLGDPEDYFRVSLNEGDRIQLAIGDSLNNDLDLYLYDGSGAQVAVSDGFSALESLSAPAGGIYFVRVSAYSGASNYILTIGGDPADTAGGALSIDHEFVPGQAIVRFADSTQATSSLRALTDRAAALGMDLASGGTERAVLLTFDDENQKTEVFKALSIDENAATSSTSDDNLRQKRDTLRVIEALRNRTDVLSADPNYILHHYAVTPNDIHYDLQWHYPLINLPRAWEITTNTDLSANEVVVAVIDTGVLTGHPDLAGQLTDDGYDFISDISISNDNDGIDDDPEDPGDSATPGSSSFHGTHCAGTVAASTDNVTGLAGVGWGTNTNIMPIRVLGIGGGTLYDILQGVRYAAGLQNDSETVPAKTADIISLSLGGPGYSDAAQDVFNQVRTKGIIVIAAAGNESTSTLSYPASYDGVISVSAVDIDATLASYSNYGSGIDVAAPGGDTGDFNGDGYPDYVWSTCGDDSAGSIQYNYTAYIGTSMATPHVAGVAALMKALRPTLTATELDGYLQNGLLTNDIGDSGRDNLYGYGLIDAYKAALVAQDDSGLTVLTAYPAVLNIRTTFSAEETLTVSRIGDGPLAVADITDNADWLSVEANSVDGDGLGTYTIRAERGDLPSSLPDGTYNGRIAITDNDGGVLVVAVNLQLITSSGSANAGVHYVLLVDADTDEVVQQDVVRAVNGSYEYSFTGITKGGEYLIYAGSDRDNDAFIGDAGEFLGVYRSLDQITTITADSNRTDLDFATDLRLFLPTASQVDDRGRSSPVLKRMR